MALSQLYKELLAILENRNACDFILTLLVDFIILPQSRSGGRGLSRYSCQKLTITFL